MDKKDIFSNLKNIPVLTLDCNEEFEADSKQFDEHSNKVADFIKKHSNL